MCVEGTLCKVFRTGGEYIQWSWRTAADCSLTVGRQRRLPLPETKETGAAFAFWNGAGRAFEECYNTSNTMINTLSWPRSEEQREGFSSSSSCRLGDRSETGVYCGTSRCDRDHSDATSSETCVARVPSLSLLPPWSPFWVRVDRLLPVVEYRLFHNHWFQFVASASAMAFSTHILKWPGSASARGPVKNNHITELFLRNSDPHDPSGPPSMDLVPVCFCGVYLFCYTLCPFLFGNKG